MSNKTPPIIGETNPVVLAKVFAVNVVNFFIRLSVKIIPKLKDEHFRVIIFPAHKIIT